MENFASREDEMEQFYLWKILYHVKLVKTTFKWQTIRNPHVIEIQQLII